MCYYAKFGHSRSNRVRIRSGEPADQGLLGPCCLGMEGVAWWLTAEKQAPPPYVTRPNLVILH